MFLAQIHSIEDQIASLEEQMRVAQQQLQQYQNLREKAENAIALLLEIQQQSEAINEGHNWKNCVMHALQISDPLPPTPQPPSAHFDAAQEPQAEIEEGSSEDSQISAWREESTADDEYSTPEALASALEEGDIETVLMGIANVLDAAPAIEIESRVMFFIQNLPMELCDRIINYLPQSIIPTWRSQVAARKLETEEQEARASIFPAEAPTAPEYEPVENDIVECKSNGLVGRVVHLNDSPNGRMASVLLPGGTSNFHVSNLKFIAKHEEKPSAASQPHQEEVSVSEPVSDETDQLARQCLGLRSWSQMRIFADQNADVITRMYEIAATKTEKRIINNLPSLIVGYINRAGDRSDLGWLPDQLLAEVETLIQQAA
jgi:hypothetical protein